MSSNTVESQTKPTKYYIDFENVHGAGLKGVDALTERDEVIIIYSQAAETFHIEHAIDILKSQARIRFVEADAGTRNAADFQLIVALYADMDNAYDYAIVSGDGGFDAAIKMGERMGKPQVRRLGNIAGDEAEPEKPKSRRSRRSRSGRDAAKDAAEAEAPAQGEAAAETAESPAPVAEAEAVAPAADDAVERDEVQAASQEGEQKSSSSRRRSRRRKRSSSSEEQAAAQTEAEQAQGDSSSKADGVAEAGAEPKSFDDAPRASAANDAEAPSDKPVESDAIAEELQGESKKPDAPQPEADAAKRPRKRSSKRTSTRKETDDAYARAAEAMRLASESASARDAAAAEKPQPEPAAAEAPTPDASAEKDAAEVSSLVKDLLEQQGVQLSDTQVATVASALVGPDGRQGFYRRIIKIERQQNGRALYHQVRDHYKALLEAIQK